MAQRERSAEELFGAALELAPERRAAFLDDSCGSVPNLRADVERLLEEEERMGSFLEKGVFPARGLSPDSETSGPASRPNGSRTSRFHAGDAIAGRFEVVQFLARGGMGEVYEVRDRFLPGVDVALKIIRPEIAADTGSARRFEQEVILARKVSHPNLCPIYDISRCEQPEPPFVFLTMKLLRGVTLEDRLKFPDRLPAVEAIEICRQLLGGVMALHQAGIVHRDIKPNNIMLEELAGRTGISLMDFGLARLQLSESITAQPVTIAGTLGYMAPELLRGQPPSKASDLYALGIVMHQVLTGERPAENAKDSSLTPAAAMRSMRVPDYLVEAITGFLSTDLEKRVRAFERVELAEGPPSAETRTSFPASKTVRYVAAAIFNVTAIALAVWVTSPPVPRPLLSQQITVSSELKERPLVADRSRLYFQSRGRASTMAMNGGTIAPLPSLGSGFTIQDASPDGSKVLALKANEEAMEAGTGTVWIASTLGGAPRRLGSFSAQDMRWSPDGQSILFAEKGRLYTIQEDGSNQKKLWEGDGVIDSLNVSPDGRELAWALIDAQGHSREWWMKADGSHAHPVLTGWPAAADQWFGQWTRDGKHFVFLSDRLARESTYNFIEAANVYELVFPRWFEFWKKPIGALLTVNQLDIQALAPGPDGDSLFVLGQADQGAMQVLDPATGRYVPFLGGLPAAAFVISPDRQWMAYTEFPSGNLWKSRLDGSEAMQLTTTVAVMEEWSPDGKSLVYSDGRKLYMISADGGTPDMLLGSGRNEVSPSWRPDGKAIDFTYWDGVTNPRKGIYEADLDTRKVSIRSGTEELFGPAWSPDGKYLAAVGNAPWRIMLYAAETKTWTELKNSGVPLGSWTWSNDSKALYMRVQQGQPGVYRMTVPDGSWTKVSGLEGLNEMVYDISISMTADDRPALISHTGSTQIYSMRWPK